MGTFAFGSRRPRHL